GSRADFVDKAKQPLPPIGAPVEAASAVEKALPPPPSTGDSEAPVAPQIEEQPQAAEQPKPPAAPIACPLVLLIGGPGSGRRRVCRELARRYDFQAVCFGDLARGATAKDSLTNSAALALLTDALGRLPVDCQGVFVEGFPWNEAQLGELLLQVQSIKCALLLDFHEAALRKRLEDRAVPADEAAARLEKFRSATLPVCRHLDDEGKLLLLPVDGEPGDGAADAGVSVVAGDAVALLERVLGAPSKPAAETSAPAAPHPTGPQLYIRTLDFDVESATESVERDTDLPACPILLLLGGPGSGRSALCRRLAAAFDGFVRVDARDALGGDSDADSDNRPDGRVEAEALRRLLSSTALAGARCVLLEGYPTCEADLRDACARLGRPDLAVLIDCSETGLLARLASLPEEDVAARLRYFKEETLPVVRSLDAAGRLSVIDGDRSEEAVLADLKALIDFPRPLVVLALLIAWTACSGLWPALAVSDRVSSFRNQLSNNSLERELITKLVDKYTQTGLLGRPVNTTGDLLEINFGLAIIQILDLDENKQLLRTNCWVRYTWLDRHLKWEGERGYERFQNITQVRLEPDSVWKPDIQLYNFADTRPEEKRTARVVVYWSGEVLWHPQSLFKSTCAVEIQYFPFDTQLCALEFGSWTYDMTQINLTWVGYEPLSRFPIPLGQLKAENSENTGCMLKRKMELGGELGSGGGGSQLDRWGAASPKKRTKVQPAVAREWPRRMGQGISWGEEYEPNQYEPSPYIDFTNYIKSKEWITDGQEDFEIRPSLRRRQVRSKMRCTRVKFQDENGHEYSRTYQRLVYKIRIRRNPAFYLSILVLPCLLLSCLTWVIFWLPPESPAKMQLGMNIFVAFFILMLLLAKTTPSAVRNFPYIGYFYGLNMVLITLSTFLAAIVLNLYMRADSRGPMHPALRRGIVDGLGRLLLVRQAVPLQEPSSESKPDPAAPDERRRQQQPETAAAAQKLQQKSPMSNFDGAVAGVAGGQVERDVREIRQLFRVYVGRLKDRERRCQAAMEWRTLAIVLDRLFFTAYVICILVAIIICLPRPDTEITEIDSVGAPETDSCQHMSAAY
uniref:Adenylate kinase n=1 Tax=Macrostomum lignano TaxID=282301 RepID=A0A1I8IMT7_9PLAT